MLRQNLLWMEYRLWRLLTTAALFCRFDAFAALSLAAGRSVLRTMIKRHG